MPDAADFFSGKYITAAELPKDRRLTATVTAVTEETMQLSDENKLVLALANAAGKPHPRRLPLNITNGKSIMAAFGRDYTTWVGRQIELWAEPTKFAGKTVMGVRIMPIGNGHSSPMPDASPAGGGGKIEGDEIPWPACVQ